MVHDSFYSEQLKKIHYKTAFFIILLVFFILTSLKVFTRFNKVVYVCYSCFVRLNNI